VYGRHLDEQLHVSVTGLFHAISALGRAKEDLSISHEIQ
jgi:hypothetical protein